MKSATNASQSVRICDRVLMGRGAATSAIGNGTTGR
jgi:hypothetical protein